MDAITLLRNDHKTVEQLFRRFEKTGDDALVEKRQIVDRIIEELSIHAEIEEQVFYPVARSTVEGAEDITLESLEEHHIVKWVLSELENLDPAHERFDAKVTVLMENVRHHVEEEETEFFPKVRSALGRKSLADLGDALETAKRSAPTHPHPRSPDTPPGNSVVGTIAGVVDRVGDNLSGIAQGGVSAAQDIIARVLGNDSPASSPTGSSIARDRAVKVRKAAAGGSRSSSSSAKSAASSPARSAGSSAKKTGSAAKKAGSAATKSTPAKSAGSAAKKAASAATKSAPAKRAGSAAKSAGSTAKKAGSAAKKAGSRTTK